MGRSSNLAHWVRAPGASEFLPRTDVERACCTVRFLHLTVRQSQNSKRPSQQKRRNHWSHCPWSAASERRGTGLEVRFCSAAVRSHTRACVRGYPPGSNGDPPDTWSRRTQMRVRVTLRVTNPDMTGSLSVISSPLPQSTRCVDCVVG